MLSDTIRQYRKARHMSQDELAEKLGVSRQSVSLWETGQTQPTIDNILALAKIFNVSTDAILDNVGVDSPPPADPPVKKKRINLPFILIVVATLAAAGIILTVILTNGGTAPSGPEKAETVSPVPTETVPAQAGTSAPTEKTTERPAEQPTQKATQKPTAKPTEKATAKPTEKATVPAEPFDLFAYCREFAIDIGTLQGDYCIYMQPASRYGGNENEYVSLSYWADSDMVEFCLHCPLNDIVSINFFLRMRGGYDHRYEYLTSRYYRSSGVSIRSAAGYIDPAVFSDRRPLPCDSYEGGADGQDDFMEESRVGICDLIRCLKQFVKAEGMECGFSAFEFKNF